MPFVSIPQISGPTYGGFIYGLNFKKGYDEAASQLSISIVNEDGVYIMPKIWSKQTVKIADFVFNGEVLSYDYNFTPEGKTLEVVLIEDSILLDRINVILFRRGLPGVTATKISRRKTITIDRYVPATKVSTIGGVNVTIFEFYHVNTQMNLGPRDVYGVNKKINSGIIILGDEEYMSNSCSIPDAKYNLSTLISVSGIIDGVDPNPNYLQSYEGSLRSVLQSWCGDFGLSFYWKNGRVQLIDLKTPIVELPDITSCEILEKKISESGEGTFDQRGLGVFQKEGSDGNETSVSTTSYEPFIYYDYDVSLLNSGGSDYGGGRSKVEFYNCCLLSYMYEPLRKYYAWYKLSNPYILGLKLHQVINSDTLLDNLVQAGIDTKLYVELKTRDPNITFALYSYDEAAEQRWVQYESDVASNFIGKYYRGPQVTNSETIQCSRDCYVQYSLSASPGGSRVGGRGHNLPWANLIKDFTDTESPQPPRSVLNSQIVFDRSGAISHSPDEFMKILGLDANGKGSEFETYLPKRLDLFENPIVKNAVAKMVPGADLSKMCIFAITSNSVIQSKFQINISPLVGQNPKEKTENNSSQSPDNACEFDKNCKGEDEEIQKFLENYLRSKGRTFAGGPSAPNPYVEGLSSAASQGINVSFGGKSGKFFLPSTQPYRGFTQRSTELRLLPSAGDDARRTSSVKVFGSIGGLNERVAESRYIIENSTNEKIDINNLQELTAEDISIAQTISQPIPRKTVSYKTFGFELLPMSPTSGLESLNVTFSDKDGMSCDYVYATRPAKEPKPDTRLRIPDVKLNKTSFRE